MCNTIHLIHNKIPKTGYGWKIFEEDINGLLHPLLSPLTFYKEGWNKWNENLSKKDGFCFFDDYSEAEKAQIEWGTCTLGWVRNIVIKKLEYINGLCKQDEKSFISSFLFETQLCKKFRIIKETFEISKPI